VGEVERIGDVDHDLPRQVRRAGRAQRVDRDAAARAVEDELRTGRGVGKRALRSAAAGGNPARLVTLALVSPEYLTV